MVSGRLHWNVIGRGLTLAFQASGCVHTLRTAALAFFHLASDLPAVLRTLPMFCVYSLARLPADQGLAFLRVVSYLLLKPSCHASLERMASLMCNLEQALAVWFRKSVRTGFHVFTQSLLIFMI